MFGSFNKEELQFLFEMYLGSNPMMLTDAEKQSLREEFENANEREYVSHYFGDFVDYVDRKDLFKDFAGYVNKKRTQKGMRVLDVAAGIHVRSSIALMQMGAIVTAMDPMARKRLGVRVKNKNFKSGTSLKDYDLIVGVRVPEECVRNIVEAAIAQGKEYIIIPSGDAFVDDSGRAKFVSDYDGATIKPWEVENSWAFKVVTNL